MSSHPLHLAFHFGRCHDAARVDEPEGARQLLAESALAVMLRHDPAPLVEQGWTYDVRHNRDGHLTTLFSRPVDAPGMLPIAIADLLETPFGQDSVQDNRLELDSFVVLDGPPGEILTREHVRYLEDLLGPATVAQMEAAWEGQFDDVEFLMDIDPSAIDVQKIANEYRALGMQCLLRDGPEGPFEPLDVALFDRDLSSPPNTGLSFD